MSIGAPDAEADQELLGTCFVDSGALEEIRSASSHASIVVGRTGQGKSAVLVKLAEVEHNSLVIRPLELAFRFVENSTVIRFFEDAGVNLNLFYRLLWRHVLVTELIRERFNLRDQGALDRWIDGISSRINKDSAKSRSLSYLKKWGEKFWQETEVRLTEVTQAIEKELSASLEGSALAGKLSAGGRELLSESEKSEVFTRGSSVVSKIQIADLNRVMQVLAEEAFKDDQNRYYICIDALDEDWVSHRAKLRLIRALIEEVRTFRSELRNAKIVVALRQDLIERVFELTRDGGFQEEKYEIYYARIGWSRPDLVELLSLRVAEVFKRKYTSQAVTLQDVFPSARSESPLDYMLDRTLLRPRDLIAFANECFRVAEQRTRVSWAAIQEAESAYSRKRRNALIDEWATSLPCISAVLDLLQGKNETFSRSSIDQPQVDSLAMQLAMSDGGDELTKLCKRALEPKSSVTTAQILSAAIRVLYHVGAVGVKYSTESPFLWSHLDDSTITAGDAKRVNSIKVHKMLWKALDIRTGNLWRASGGRRQGTIKADL